MNVPHAGGDDGSIYSSSAALGDAVWVLRLTPVAESLKAEFEIHRYSFGP